MDTLRNSQIAVDLTENQLLKNSALHKAAMMSTLSTYQHSALVSTKSTLLETDSTRIDRSHQTKSVSTKVTDPIACFLRPLIDSLSYKASIVDQESKLSKRPKVSCEKKVSAKPLFRNVTKKTQKTDRATKERKCETESENIEDFSKDICGNTDCNFRIPDYNLEADFQPEVSEFQKFLPPEKDQCILKSLAPTYDRLQHKRALLNAASASLVQSPNFRNPHDAVRLNLMETVDKLLADDDAEFVLKVALYSRCELNIRTPANFLLAYAASQTPCRPYLHRYFRKAVCLPSDWIEVAELYQEFKDPHLTRGSLPTALRKAMIAKFPDFDKYQLSKYNKEKSGKKKIKKQHGKGQKGGSWKGKPEQKKTKKKKNDSSDESTSEEEEKESGKEGGKLSFSLKQLIRKLHVAEPVEHVMCLVGKRYPLTLEDFYQKRLPGTYDEERAGKRMKLPVAETWETQVSLKGNKAETWEQLIDHKKLPFMAMLRNLRNLIKAGISEKHHSWVVNKLSDEGAVTHSKQFPFRFFSAYEVIGGLENDLKSKEDDSPPIEETIVVQIGDETVRHTVPRATGIEGAARGRGGAPTRGRVRGRGRGRGGAAGGRGGAAGEGGGEVGQRGSGGPGRGRGRGGRTGGRGRGRGRGKVVGGRSDRPKKAKTPAAIHYDEALLNRYRKALDAAVKIATVHNVKPIRGTTTILCSLMDSMVQANCTSARGLGKPRKIAEVAVLLGLMCKYSCEKCEFIVYGSNRFQSVELEKGTILNNMDRVMKLADILNSSSSVEKPLDGSDHLAEVSDETPSQSKGTLAGLIEKHLMNILTDRTQVNNLILLADDFNPESELWPSISQFVSKYRFVVDPDMLFVGVNLGKAQTGLSAEHHVDMSHENDVFISGFSDQLLRFIAERGEGAQLVHVEKIDEAYELKPLPKKQQQEQRKNVETSPEQPLPLVSLVPRWRTARVFISSTFRDMHGERDLLTRFVFPELRARAEKRLVNLYEIDLRWGISEEDSSSKSILELCLTQVSNCHLFVGILGNRYGWIPASHDIPQSPEFQWVFENLGVSVTELEMYSGALSRPTEAVERAFFYIRDDEFLKDVPLSWQPDFAPESDSSLAEKLENLKSRIRKSGLEVYDRYPCFWGGVVGEKPIVAGLEQFGIRVLNNMWNAIERLYPSEDNFLDEFTHESAQHDSLFASLCDRSIGRKVMLRKAFDLLRKTPSGLVVVHGKPGCGKSSVMASIARRFVDEKLVGSGLDVLVHSVGAAPGSTNIVCVLRRLCRELGRRINTAMEIPSHFKNLVDRFHLLLEESSAIQSNLTPPTPLVLFLDGLDLLEKVHDAPSLNWLPERVPANVLIVVSVRDESAGQKSLFQHQDCAARISVDPLDSLDRAEVVRQTLAKHAKRLDELPFNNQVKILVSKRESNIPLYLSLACEEVRVFGVFEKVTQKLNSLPHTLTQLLSESLSRIESDNGTRLVATSLSLLLCSRDGLEENELTSLLTLDRVLNGSYRTVDDVRNVCLDPEKFIPSVTILRLVRSLETFLRPLETTRFESRVLRLDQLHVRNAVQHRYLKGPNAIDENALHLLLAGYYYTVADCDRDGSWSGKNQKAFSELPYHLASAASYGELSKVLCDLSFIRARCMLGLSVATLHDFDVPVLSSASAEHGRTKLVSDQRFVDYQNFVSRNLHVLSTCPALTLQQALNEPSSSYPSADARKLLVEKKMAASGLVEWMNKSEDPDSCVRTVDDLPDVVTCVALSPDGTFLAVALRDCTVRLYEMTSPAIIKELKMFCGHSSHVNGLCFVSKSRLCSASADGTLSLWSIDGGHRISVLKGHSRSVSSCASDPTGSVIVSVGWDFSIKLWNGQTGAAQGYLANDRRPINCVAFHPEGQVIVTGDWDCTLKLWDVFHKSRKGILRGHQSSVRDVAFSPSGRHIASAALDGEVKIWSATHGSSVGALSGHSLPINCLAFSPSGQELVTASDDSKVKVWSGNIGRALNRIGDEKLGPVMCVALDATGEFVAAGYHEGFVRVFATGSGNLVWEKTYFRDPISIVCIKYKLVEELDFATEVTTTTSDALFVGMANGCLLMLNGWSGELRCTVSAHRGSVMTLDLSRNAASGFVVTGGEDFTAKLFEYSELQSKNKVAESSHTLEGHTAPVTCVALNKDETKLATGSRDRNFTIWNIKTPRHVTIERVLCGGHSDWITCCAWSNAADFLVTGSNDFNLKLWDMTSGSVKPEKVEKVKFTGHLSAISSVAYQYGCIVSSSNDGTVKVWSHKGAEVTTLYAHTQRVNACDVHFDIQQEPVEKTENSDWATMADEEDWKTKHEELKVTKKDVKVERVVLASCSDDGTIRLWLPIESSELSCLVGHSGKVTALATGHDGFICSAGLDHSMKLWKATAMSPSVGHESDVTAAICSQDGSTLVTTGRDGTMRIWSRQVSSTASTCSGVPQLIMTVKVGKKSVNCAQFVGSNNLLLSGSDDGYVVLWDLDFGKFSQAKKLASLLTSGPVSSLAVTSSDSPTVCNVFVTHLNCVVSLVTVKNLGTKDPDMTITALLKGHSDWCVASTTAIVGGRSVVLTGGADSCVLSWQSSSFDKDVATTKGVNPSNVLTRALVYESSEETLNWVTSITAFKDFVYFGDSTGNLISLKFDRITGTYAVLSQKRIHAGRLTCIVCVDALIFTGSSDRTIKVWNTNLVQVGQFLCKAPVTCLALAESEPIIPSRHRLICGNSLGEVLFLAWIY